MLKNKRRRCVYLTAKTQYNRKLSRYNKCDRYIIVGCLLPRRSECWCTRKGWTNHEKRIGMASNNNKISARCARARASQLESMMPRIDKKKLYWCIIIIIDGMSWLQFIYSESVQAYNTLILWCTSIIFKDGFCRSPSFLLYSHDFPCCLLLSFFLMISLAIVCSEARSIWMKKQWAMVGLNTFSPTP